MSTWLPIPGYEGLYAISDDGRLWSRPRGRNSGGFLAGFITTQGYLFYALSKNNKVRTAGAHVFVAEAFIGPRPEDYDIRHLNGDKRDNRVANLVYGTRSENEYDKVRHGTHHEANKTHCRYGHPFSPENTRIERQRRGRRRVCKTCVRERRIRTALAATEDQP